jgi:aminoglycoside 6'-N-acetyltransferase
MNSLHNITFRESIPSDLETLLHWDEQTHVINSDPDDEWNWESELKRNPAWRKQIMAELNGKPLGFIQIINAKEEETHYWGKVSDGIAAIDIWIGEENNLGKGYGTIMMNYAIEQCFADIRINEILIDPLESNTAAHRFYERVGFKFLRHQKFGDQNCRVYSLKRVDWENKKSNTPAN